jgi:hypothetical protein
VNERGQETKKLMQRLKEERVKDKMRREDPEGYFTLDKKKAKGIEETEHANELKSQQQQQQLPNKLK